MSSTYTNFKVDNGNYSNKDLAEIFNPPSPFGYKYIYGDVWDVNSNLWRFYGSGGRGTYVGDASYPGQAFLSTGTDESGQEVSGMNYPAPVIAQNAEFIFKLDSGSIDSSLILHIGLTDTEPISQASFTASAYISIAQNADASNNYFFYGYINGTKATGPLIPIVLDEWYYANIQIDKLKNEITFKVEETADPTNVKSEPVNADTYDFSIGYYVVFETIGPLKFFNIDYIGISYTATRGRPTIN